MRRAIAFGLLLCGALSAADGFWDSMQEVIRRHLGRPYVWGATGMKSFDCSGFVWRVLYENGTLIKRTTARKLYMSLPQTSKTSQWDGGNIVFFDDLKHCGIVSSRGAFYHAESSKGTTLSPFEPYWRPKVCGVRAAPRPAN